MPRPSTPRAALLIAALCTALIACQSSEKLPHAPPDPIANAGPNDQRVIDDSTPLFSWRLRDPIADGERQNFRLQVHRERDDALVLDEFLVRSATQPLEAEFPRQPLDTGEGYYWRVSRTGSDGDGILHSRPTAFALVEDVTAVIGDDWLSCAQNHLQDPSFSGNDWAVHSGDARIDTNSTDDLDAGLAILGNAAGNEGTLSQRLATPLSSGQHYRLQFSLRTAKADQAPVVLQAWAYNGQPATFTPGPDVALLGQSVPVPPITEWSRVDLPVWQATGNFEFLAIRAVAGASAAQFELDRLCLTPTDDAPCEPAGSEAEIAEALAQGAEAVEWTLDRGAVADLYPALDTSTAHWYGELDPQVQGCFAGGGEVPETEIADILAQSNGDDLDGIESLGESFEKDFEIGNSTDLSDDADIAPIVIGEDKCSGEVDFSPVPNRPFGGRDVAYVHGLQMAAIAGNFATPPTYQGRWPGDPGAFGPGGGQFYDEAAHYWEQHIERGLGSLTQPWNTYLIVSYSANQRLKYGVHAVASQLVEAMRENTTAPIVWAGGNAGECFGRNGLVLVSHSTGALLSSSLMGIAAASQSDTDLQASYGDLSALARRFSGHVSISGALGGSPLASAGLMLANSVGPIYSATQRLAVQHFFEGTDPNDLVQIAPQLNQSVLVDLMPHVATSVWASGFYHLATAPTVTLAAGHPALGQGSAMTWPGKFLIRGFDDGVLSMASQAGSQWSAQYFDAHNLIKLADMSQPLAFKRSGLGAERRPESGLQHSLRHYPVIPALSQTGMVQSGSVRLSVTPVEHWPGHYSVLQTTGDHFDDVNELNDEGVDYQPSISGNIRNNEESFVVTDSAVYQNGLLDPALPGLVREEIRGKTIDLHLPKIVVTWVSRQIWGVTIRLPRFSVHWVYKYWYLWKRTHHLLQDYQHMTGMDYLYRHVLK